MIICSQVASLTVTRPHALPLFVPIASPSKASLLPYADDNPRDLHYGSTHLLNLSKQVGKAMLARYSAFLLNGGSKPLHFTLGTCFKLSRFQMAASSEPSHPVVLLSTTPSEDIAKTLARGDAGISRLVDSYAFLHEDAQCSFRLGRKEDGGLL